MLYLAAIRHFFKAQNQHGLHSPFVFDLYRLIIEKDTQSADFDRIESVRAAMKSDNRSIEITDLGAGSLVNQSKTRLVKDIARNSEKSARLGRLFYRLIQYFNCQNIFDLGTSLGQTTLYLASANRHARVATFEGCPQTAAIAQQNFSDFENIRLIVGNLDQTLTEAVEQVEIIDFAFFDANHRYEPTVRYFETCLKKANENSLFIFDDIHWSGEMEAAWAYIQQHPSVTVTIDLFSVGLVFFRTKQQKQHFMLRWPFWKK